MPSPYFRVIKGSFVIVGKEPDGDSVRFVADDLGLYQALRNAFRIKPTVSDGSVQLRFEAVDAPELHYGTAAQTMGDTARDKLLDWMGFRNIQYAQNPPSQVVAANPASVRGCILTKMAEANGRPVSYVLLEADAAPLVDGNWIHVRKALLQATMNYKLLETGMAYYTVYTSTSFEHKRILHPAAAKARTNKLGVWALDSTSDFKLVNQASIGPGGQLILPKLFRRATDYLKDLATGFNGNLGDWIVAHSTGTRTENDGVLVGDTLELRLSDLIEQRNDHVIFKSDLLNIQFIEK